MAENEHNASVLIPADLRLVASVRAFAYEFVCGIGASEKDAHRTEFIVGELCSNAIEYGKKSGSKVNLTITVIDNGSIRIECTNSSKDDALSSEEIAERLKSDFDPDSKRGRGLFIVRQWTKDVVIEDLDGGLKISVVQFF